MLLAALGMALGLRVLIEQPAQSTLEVHPSFEWLSTMFEAGKVSRVELLSCCPCFLEVYKGSIWHGLYYYYQSTPKRQWLWSNDQELLSRIVACAGTMPPGTMRNFQGESLTKRHKGPDGKVTWSGNGKVLTASQLFGCNIPLFLHS